MSASKGMKTAAKPPNGSDATRETTKCVPEFHDPAYSPPDRSRRKAATTRSKEARVSTSTSVSLCS